MTGRTHDLAAFTALTFTLSNISVFETSLPTVFVALSANFIGGLAPDLDQPTARLWRNIRGGSILGRLLSPLLGGHRFISHSIIGFILFGVGLSLILKLINTFLLVDMSVVWWAFMIGFLSHLIMDSLTKEGVPWLFPIPIHLGFPPIKFFRIKTGGWFEKYLIFPSLILINFYIIYTNYPKFIAWIKLYIS